MHGRNRCRYVAQLFCPAACLRMSYQWTAEIPMHELSIAMSLLDVAEEAAEHPGGVRVEAIHIKLGPRLSKKLCFHGISSMRE